MIHLYFKYPSPLRNEQKKVDIDMLFLLGCLGLLGLGLVMIASASTEVSLKDYGYSTFFLQRQLLYLAVGLVAGLLVLLTPMSFWFRYRWELLFIGGALLVLVLIPVIGKEVNGAKRWLNLPFFSVQPSEFAKIIVVIFTATYLANRNEYLRTSNVAFFTPLLWLVPFSILLLVEPDFGATVVLLGSASVMLYLGGLRLPVIIFLFVAIAVAGYFIVGLESYRLDRLQNFRDPFADPYGKGYQLSQALIAYGRGGITGLGLGNSVQKQFFLPEAHTDFIFSVLAEELGLVGAIAAIAMFGFVVLRAIYIGIWSERASMAASRNGQLKNAVYKRNLFNAYIAYGLATIWIGQILINLGVNVGLLPTKGLTLPFLSYGGSSLLACCISVALLLRIEWEHRTDMRFHATETPRQEVVYAG